MKLLIVDDEVQIRTGLEAGIPWETLGISKVFTANNGIEAIQICKKEKPQIVITDIRMPEISGLEMGRKIKEMYNPVEVIILSGYSEFEYARKALEIGAFDYLLKPIRIKELVACVEKSKKKIEDFYLEMKQKTRVSELVEAYKILNLLKQKKALKKNEIEIFETFCSTELKNQILVGICELDQLDEKVDRDTQILIDKKIVELIDKGNRIKINNKRYAIIISVISDFDQERKVNTLQQKQKKINETLKKEMETTFSISLSEKGDSKEIPRLYLQAERLMRKRMYLGKEMFVDGKEKKEIKIRQNPLDPSMVRKTIERLDYEYMHQYIQEIFLNLESQKVDSEDFVRSICEQLKSILFQVMLEKGIDIEKICENNQEFLNDIPRYLTIDEYKNWIDTFYEMMIQGLSALSGKQHSRAILKAVDFISQNYSRNINLEITAEYVQKSKNYFSYLFKKELGVSFVEYLNIVRIGEAKKLLDTTDDRTYEIAEKVGFSDYKYFSSVFKKIVGVSPSKYKKGEWNEET